MSFKSYILTTVIDYTALVSLLTNDDVLSLVNFLPTKPFSTAVLASSRLFFSRPVVLLLQRSDFAASFTNSSWLVHFHSPSSDFNVTPHSNVHLGLLIWTTLSSFCGLLPVESSRGRGRSVRAALRSRASLQGGSPPRPLLSWRPQWLPRTCNEVAMLGKATELPFHIQ